MTPTPERHQIDGTVAGSGLPQGSVGSEGLIRALRCYGPDGDEAQLELAAWILTRRTRLVPPEQVLAELKQLVGMHVTPAFPPAEAPEIQRKVVHTAIRMFYAEP